MFGIKAPNAWHRQTSEDQPMASSRMEDIDHERLDLFRTDKTSWTEAQWEGLTERKTCLARLEQRPGVTSTKRTSCLTSLGRSGT